MPAPDHRVRLRDGEREIDVSGNPAFVRQVLDDLPALMARLRGEAAGRTTISMPPPPAREAAPVVEHEEAPAPAAEEPPATAANGRNGSRTRTRHGAGAVTTDGTDDLERQVFDVLRGSKRPLAISAIRERLEGQPTGQEVRRLLERAGDRVNRSTDRPATYSLR